MSTYNGTQLLIKAQLHATLAHMLIDNTQFAL